MTCIDTNELLMFGGAFVGGTLAKEHLHHCKIQNDVAKWNEINVEGTKPSRRYGHTLKFNKPNLILFGGSTGSSTINETWILDLMKSSFIWIKLECPGSIPR